MDKKLVAKLNRDRKYLNNVLAQYEFQKLGIRNAVVIDDDSSILRLMKSYLKDFGFDSVNVYEDEYKGLKNIAEQLPDIVVLDLKLEVTNGLNIAKVLASMIGIEIPVLLISELDKSEEQLIKAVNSERVRFLRKPIDRHAFEEKLFSLLDRNNNLYTA